MEQLFSKISKREGKLARYSQIFGNFSPEVFFHFYVAPGISRILYSVEWFTFRTFNSFLNPWKLFQVISIPFATVSKFSKFLVGKRPRLPFFLNYGAPLRARSAREFR